MELLLVNHFTKPIQGSLFRKFQEEIMNLPERLDDLDIRWEGYKPKHDKMIKSHCVDDNPIPQEYVAEYESKSKRRKKGVKNNKRYVQWKQNSG